MGGSSSRFESDNHILDFGYVETLNPKPRSPVCTDSCCACFLFPLVLVITWGKIKSKFVLNI